MSLLCAIMFLRGENMEAYFIRNMNYNDINPVEAGYECCKPMHTCGFGVREYYLIHYVVRGQGVFIIGGREYKIGKGQAFLIRPGEVMKYIADEKDPWEYIWVGFTGSAASALDNLQEPVFRISGSFFEKIKQCKDYRNMREAYLVSCIYLILCEIFEDTTEVDVVSTIKNYIDVNYMNNPKISEIAKKVSLDRKYLARIYKQKTGYTMQEYLIKKKMEAAQAFLKSNFNVNETAEMTGYSDQAAFSRAYKKHFGVTPKMQK